MYTKRIKTSDCESVSKTVVDKTGDCSHLAPLALQNLEKLYVPSVILAKYEMNEGKKDIYHFMNAAYLPDGFYVFDCSTPVKEPKFYSVTDFNGLISGNVEVYPLKKMAAYMHVGRFKELAREDKTLYDEIRYTEKTAKMLCKEGDIIEILDKDFHEYPG